MFRLWARMFQNTHMLKDMVVEDSSDDTRTHKVFHAIEEVCNAFDLAQPIWLQSNINDFKRSSKVRFMQDSFIETIEFDYLEIQILEED